MYKIDIATATDALPPATAPGPKPNSYFEDKDPASGVAGTVVPAEFMNMIQEEVCNVITDAQSGLTLNKSLRNQLIQAIKNIIDSRSSAIPSGTVTATAALNAPTGWLFCYGQAVSRATYANLFAAVGIAFGAGDGVNTFNLPDLRGRYPLGLDNMGGAGANIVTSASLGGANATTRGGTGGEQATQLQIVHQAAHTHGIGIPFNVQGGGSGGFSYATADNTIQSASSGGGQAHNNMPPWIAMNYMIKV